MEHFTLKLWFTAEFGAMVSILMNVNEFSGSSAIKSCSAIFPVKL